MRCSCGHRRSCRTTSRSSRCWCIWSKRPSRRWSARSSIRRKRAWARGWPEPGCRATDRTDQRLILADKRKPPDHLRRFCFCVYPLLISVISGSVVEPQRQPHGAGLVGQVSHTRPCPTLAVEREECPLVRQVVHEQPHVPAGLPHTEAHVEQRVRREQRIELEDVLRERTADRRATFVHLELGHVDRAERAGGDTRQTDAVPLIVDRGVT